MKLGRYQLVQMRRRRKSKCIWSKEMLTLIYTGPKLAYSREVGNVSHFSIYWTVVCLSVDIIYFAYSSVIYHVQSFKTAQR